MRWMLGREENGKNWGEKRMGKNGKNRKDRKIGNSDFIDSVGDNIVTNSYVRKVQINWFFTLPD